ncbi:MAG: protein kinase [Acidobacteriota bacterium]
MIGVAEIDRKYDVLAKLGEGGMGTVYKVRHRYLDELRVIKTIKANLNVDEDLQQRFLREAQVAAKLRHPNIATIHDFSVGEDGTAFIAMEFIEGMNLREYQKAGKRLDVAQVAEVGRQTLAALAYLHSKQFVHRDISTDNMMLSWDDDRIVLKLIDLGLAKSLENDQQWHTKTGTVVGKVRYISPEQLNAGMSGAGVDHRSDLYSFGVVLYELLTRQFPITGADEMSMIAGHLYRPPKSFEETDPNATVPIPLRRVILKALEKDPKSRFCSADEFSRAITTSISGVGTASGISPAAGSPGAKLAETTELAPGLSQQLTQPANVAENGQADEALATPPDAATAPSVNTTSATAPTLAAPLPPVAAGTVATAPASSFSDLESAPTATLITDDAQLAETALLEPPQTAPAEPTAPLAPAKRQSPWPLMAVAITAILALVGWFGLRPGSDEATTPSDDVATTATGVSEPSSDAAGTAGISAAGDSIFFGTHHALVIGNNNYLELPGLETAINDARAMADLLERRYGFQVRLLEDVNRTQLISALHDFNETLTARDNLLVYYAGHGQLQGESEYWQPIDAQPDRTTNWISTRFEISATLKQSAARHILVVADSCYSGAIAGVESLAAPAAQGDLPIRELVKRPSRLVLTSGGLSPVLDTGDARHSLFARVLLAELQKNREIRSVSSLFPAIRDEVSRTAIVRGGEQVPILAPIPDSLDEGGEFFFVPKPTTSSG